jgi:gamma-glutamyltranspeptidase/glutathione hydrolase
MIEAKKIAWADRAKFYADPDFAKAPVAELISKPYAAVRRKLIDPNHAAKTVEAGNPALGQGDTIYMCTADDEGNMVSLIQSNYSGFGSGLVPSTRASKQPAKCPIPTGTSSDIGANVTVAE